MKNKEIDFLIAEKIMSYRVIPPSVHEETGFENSGYFVIKEETEDEDAIWISQFEFCPTIDLKDAWEVVDKLHSKFSFELFREDTDDYYICDFTSFNEFIEVDIQARGSHETAPMSICIAALKTIGIEIN